MKRLLWLAGGMAVAAILAADDFDAHQLPAQLLSDDNGHADQRDLDRFEGEGGPPSPFED